MRAKTGYKAIHCRGCGLQQLSSRNKCQCGIIWHHCTIHRTDPAFHRSKKAQKRTKEEQEKRRLAKEREEAAKGGRTRPCKRKTAPPIVEEGAALFRNRRGKKAKGPAPRNFTLKLMRSVSVEVRCDPKMIERVRLKEKRRGRSSQREEGKFVPADTVDKLSPTFSAPFLDDGFTELEWPEIINKKVINSERHVSGSSSSSPAMAESSTTSKVRAYTDQNMMKVYSRNDFNKHIMFDVETQAAKRRKTSMQESLTHASKNSNHGQEVHKNTRTVEFKDFGSSSSARRREHKALGRLLSAGCRDKEYNEGRLLLHTDGSTSECMPASTLL